MSLLNGIKGLWHFLKDFFKETPVYPHVHPSAIIPKNAIIYNPDNLYLDERVSLGSNAVIMNPNANFIMKKWSFTARDFLAIDGNHMSVVGMPMRNVTDEIKAKLDVNHKYNKDIIVEEDVWIGARVTLCSGCHVGRGSIIAAGAVVTKEVTPYSVFGGVPARFIRFKWSVEEIMEHEKILYPESERIPQNILIMNYNMYYKENPSC